MNETKIIYYFMQKALKHAKQTWRESESEKKWEQPKVGQQMANRKRLGHTE